MQNSFLSPKKFHFLTLFLLILFYSFQLNAQETQTLGAIATQHPLATRSAEKVLQKGGNAIDAAIAAALTLSVVEPYNSGLGAGGLTVIWDSKQKKAFAIDFREMAPQKANGKMFLQKPSASRKGPLAIAVPGELAGLAHLHEKWGKLAWQDLFEDAIQYAEQGFEPSTYFKERILKKEACLSRDSHTWKIYRPFFSPRDSQVQLTSSTQTLSSQNETQAPPKLIQKNLARSLKKIRNQGIAPFYQGEIAQEMTRSIQSKGAILTLEDLKNYQVIERPVLSEKFSWGQVWTMPLPSSGGISVVRTLNTMEAIEKKWAALHKKSPEQFPSFQNQWPSLMVAVFDGVFKTRNQEMGDSDFNPKLPVNRWTSKGFARREAHSILKKQEERFSIEESPSSDASETHRYPFDRIFLQVQGFPSEKYGHNEVCSNSFQHQKKGSPPLKTLKKENTQALVKTDGQTTHLSIIDQQGNAVSMTLTQNLSFGSCVTAGKTGILMNNQMDDFATQVGQANAFGLVQSTANKIEPGKRPLSSMTPVIVTQKKQATLAIGSPGGPRIISSVAQVLFRHFYLNEEISSAIAAPRFHFQGLPKKIFIENENIFQSSQKLNYTSQLQSKWSNVQAVEFDIQNQTHRAFSDPRGIGKSSVIDK